MHVLLFYQYYHNPDCAASGRHYQFLKTLSKNHRVSVITSDVWQKKRTTYQFDWAPAGVEVHHLPVAYNNTMGSRDRLKAFWRYMSKAVLKGLRVDRPDIIIGSSTPLTAAWAAAKVAQLRRVPWIFEVRDLWPDFPVQMGAIENTWIKKRLYAMERQLYRSAAHIIPLSPDMEAHVLNHGIKEERITTILNGSDLELAEAATQESACTLLTAHGLSDKKVILYAGTLGRANGIPNILDAAKKLAHHTDIHFVILGSGFFRDEIARTAATCTNITLLDAVPRHQIFQWFRAATLSLITFINLPVLAANSPAKFFDSLAVGTPVIVTNPGWTKTFVEQHECGWYVPAEEPHTLVECIEQIITKPEALARAGANGARIAAHAFDRRQMAVQLEAILRRYVDA